MLNLGTCAYFGKWRISHLGYSLYRTDSSIRIGLFVYNFRKKIVLIMENVLILGVPIMIGDSNIMNILIAIIDSITESRETSGPGSGASSTSLHPSFLVSSSASTHSGSSVLVLS